MNLCSVWDSGHLKITEVGLGLESCQCVRVWVWLCCVVLHRCVMMKMMVEWLMKTSDLLMEFDWIFCLCQTPLISTTWRNESISAASVQFTWGTEALKEQKQSKIIFRELLFRVSSDLDNNIQVLISSHVSFPASAVQTFLICVQIRF